MRELQSEGADTEQLALSALFPLPAWDNFVLPAKAPAEFDLSSALGNFRGSLQSHPGARLDLRVHGALLRLKLAEFMHELSELRMAADNDYGIVWRLKDDGFEYKGSVLEP